MVKVASYLVNSLRYLLQQLLVMRDKLSRATASCDDGER